jgi:hypothetical protein
MNRQETKFEPPPRAVSPIAEVDKPGASTSQQHVQRTCTVCGGTFWSRSGNTNLCPVCREASGDQWSLPRGTPVSYMSASLSTWIQAHVVQFNADDTTYDLDVKLRATTDRIAPPLQGHWPVGTKVLYESSTYGGMMPASIVGKLDEGNYDLDVRRCVNREKMRVWVTPTSLAKPTLACRNPTQAQ